MITALLIFAIIVYLVERLRPLGTRWVDARENLALRASEANDLPPDLRVIARQEGTEWAREDVEKRFRELYSDLGSWAAVRDYVMVGGSNVSTRS